MKGNDLLKLLALLVLVAAIAFGAYWWSRSQGDAAQKYSHPITREGSKW
jgi:hypothetical protein